MLQEKIAGIINLFHGSAGHRWLSEESGKQEQISGGFNMSMEAAGSMTLMMTILHGERIEAKK